MLIHTSAGEIEVRGGDLFEYQAAVLEVCGSLPEPNICCRVKSGVLTVKDGDTEPVTLVHGNLIFFEPEDVATRVLAFNGPRGKKGLPLKSEKPSKKNTKSLGHADGPTLF